MSTFSTKGGLYERAQKRFAVADGKRLFTYSFYEKRKLETLVRHSQESEQLAACQAYQAHVLSCRIAHIVQRA